LAAQARSGSTTDVDSKSGSANVNTAEAIAAAHRSERYVARSELAALMGVSLATLDRLVVQGMPSETWGRRTRRFKPSVAIAWASKRGRLT
jgi:hypothetical protein